MVTYDALFDVALFDYSFFNGIFKQEVIVLNDTLKVSPYKNTSEIATLNDSIAKYIIQSARLETLSLTDSLLISVLYDQFLNEIISLTDVVKFSYTTTKLETVTLTDAATRRTRRNVADTATLTDAQSNKITTAKSDIMNIADLISKRANLNKADVSTLTDSMSRSIASTKSDIAYLQDTISKTSARNITETLTLTDSLIIPVVRDSQGGFIWSYVSEGSTQNAFMVGYDTKTGSQNALIYGYKTSGKPKSLGVSRDAPRNASASSNQQSWFYNPSG